MRTPHGKPEGPFKNTTQPHHFLEGLTPVVAGCNANIGNLDMAHKALNDPAPAAVTTPPPAPPAPPCSPPRQPPHLLQAKLPSASLGAPPSWFAGSSSIVFQLKCHFLRGFPDMPSPTALPVDPGSLSVSL